MIDASPWTRRTTLVLAGFVAACALSLIWLVHPWYEPTGNTNDASIYLLCAKSMLAGEGYAYLGEPFTLRPPGLSVLVLPVLAWRGLDFQALNLLIASFGIVAVACVFAYHQRRLGTVLALTVAASLWLNPAVERFCNRVMSDVPGTALLMVGLLLARWADRKPGAARDALTGALVGLAAYVRSVDVLLAPAIVCARICARFAAGERGGWLRFARDRCVVPLVVPALVLLPWSIRNARNPPELPVDQTYVHSYSVALLHTDTSDPDSPFVQASQLLERVRDNFAAITTSMGRRLTRDDPSATSWIVGGLVAALALAAAARRREVDDFVLLGSLVAFSISLEVRERYVLPLYVLALPSAVDTLRWLAARWTSERLARAALAVLVALVALVAAIDFAPRSYWNTVRTRHEQYLTTCAALEAALPPDAVLASTIGWHLSIYLDRPVYSLAPRLTHTSRKRALDEVIERRGINTIVFLEFRNYDDEIAELVRERYGTPTRIGLADVWRVRL